MPLINKQIPALFNGVSQQPATIRLPSQAEAQINGYSTVADGLRKRPPTEHIAKVSALDWSTAYVHTINRDVTERYVVVVTDGDLKVYDTLTGTEKTCTFPEGKAYLSTVSPYTAQESFALVSVADYTFVVNKSIVVTLAAVAADESLPAGWANYYLPPTWAAEDSAPDIKYYNVASTYVGVVQTFTDLPAANTNPAEGSVYRIAGNNSTAFGSYYVRRTGGVWEECVLPGIQNKFTDAKMPWALVRLSDGTFTFQPFKWNVRKMGDDVSNPPPTFVGRAINDVFFYKNRLAFVSDENVVFSATGDFGNFFRTTVTALLDSDLVDVASSNTKVSLIKFAVAFNNNLMLFADQTQFSLNVDQLLTPTTVSIDAVTAFEMNTRARPVGIGSDVYFATESGNYSRIREYFVQDASTVSTDASDISAHVPKYIPKSIFKLAGSSNEDVLFALSDAAGFRNRVYVYKFYWNGDDKTQSSWSYWEHGDTNSVILGMDVIESELYLLISRADGVYLEKCNVQSGQVTGALTFEVLLDRNTEVTGTYDAGNNRTTFTIPYPVVSGMQPTFKIVRGADFTTQLGALIDQTTYTWVSTTSVRVPGNEADGECHMGQNYEFRYEFSEQFHETRDGKAVTTGRLQLRTMVLYYTDTAYFQTIVDPYGTGALLAEEEVVPSAIADYTGKTLGSASLIVGTPNFDTGQYAFQIYGNSRDATIQIVNDTHVQSNLQSAEWEGMYFNRAGAG